MSIPGLAQYPDLAQKYRQQLADARASRASCTTCAVNKVHEKFRHLLSERLKRDKVLKKR